MADCKESTEETNGPRPPIIMKFDAPEESSDNSANEDTEGQSNEENSEAPPSPCSKVPKINCPVLAASKFGNSFGVSAFSNTTKRKSTLLRPSALSSVTSTTSSTTTAPGPSSKSQGLEPAKFTNPFAKVPNDRAIDDNGSLTNDADEKNDKNDGKTEVAKKEEKTSEDTTPKFLPLVASSDDNDNSVNNAIESNSSKSSFVFGQNLKDRVTVSSDADESSASSEKDEPKEEITSTSENGSSELSFSNAATVCRTSTARSGLTLTQAAQEMEEANRANKRKYNQVTLLTGEEGETNVLQINCKLFAFEATSGWQERGRGTLRLNDRDEESRLVGRAAGTQRLVLNTKIWPGMTAERAGPKSLRLTAMDVQGDIRIFIVQAAPKEVDQLHNLLLQRLKRAQERQPKKLATDHRRSSIAD